MEHEKPDREQQPADDATITNAPLNDAADRGGTQDERKRYQIIAKHASGGLGQVYVALDQQLNRRVALKEMRFPFADDHDSQERFVREAEITGALEHPGIVPVYGLGRYSDGRPYYAMRLIDGLSMKEAIATLHNQSGSQLFSSREFRKLLQQFVDVCNAIQFAHSHGYIHRDIKPANVMLGGYGETLVVDWGLSKKLGDDEPIEAEGIPAQAEVSYRATASGSPVGTPAFLSPEQARGEHDVVGKRSDIYCLGATLFCLVAGRPPHQGSGNDKVLDNVAAGRWERPRRLNSNVPKALESICLKAMQHDPADRYESADLLSADIENWLADEPVSCHPDTVGMRCARWFRHNKSLAFTLLTSLVVITVGSVLWVTLLSQQYRRSRVNEAIYRVESKQPGFRPTVFEILTEINQIGTEDDYELRQIAVDAMHDFSGHLPEAIGDFNAGNLPLCMSTSASGAYVAVGCKKGLCCVYDLSSGDELFSAAVGETSVKAVHLSVPSKDTFVVHWVDQLGRLYRGDDKHRDPTLVHDFKIEDRQCKILSADFKKNGDCVTAVVGANGKSDRLNFVWGVENGETLDEREVPAVAQSSRLTPDGTTVVLGYNDNRAETNGYFTWDIGQPGKKDVPVNVGGHYYDGLCMSSDGTLLGFGCGRSIVVDLRTGAEKFRFKNDEVRTCAISNDNRLAAFIYQDGLIEVVEIETAQVISSLRFTNLSAWNSKPFKRRTIAFSGDGKYLVAPTSDSLSVWKLETERKALQGHKEGIPWLVYSGDGSKLFSAGSDGLVRVWNASTGELITELPCNGPVQSIDLSPHKSMLAVGTRANPGCSIWSTQSWKRLLRFGEELNQVSGIAFADEGRILAAAGQSGMSVWKIGREAERLRPDSIHHEPVQFHSRHLNVWPDSRGVAWLKDGVLSVWDIDHAKVIEGIQVVQSDWSGIHFFPNGDLTVVNIKKGVVERFTNDGKQSKGSYGDDGTFQETALAISPNGQYLVGVGRNRKLTIWDTKTNKRLVSLPCKSRTYSLAWSQKNHLAVGSSTGRLVLWDINAVRKSLRLLGLDW